MRTSTEVLIAIGSNLDKERYVPAAVAALEVELEKPAFSSIYETRPVGIPDSEPFWNLCCRGRTRLDLLDLRCRLEAIEEACNRRRDPQNPYTPRTLDLDLLAYGDTVDPEHPSGPPHPQILSAAFVYVPLAEIAPDWVHPVEGRSAAEIAAEGEGVSAVLRVLPIETLF